MNVNDVVLLVGKITSYHLVIKCEVTCLFQRCVCSLL